MVRATATSVDCSILTGMAPTGVSLDAMRSAMRLAGFAWSDAELEALRPGLERALASLDELERLPLRDTGSSDGRPRLVLGRRPRADDRDEGGVARRSDPSVPRSRRRAGRDAEGL